MTIEYEWDVEEVIASASEEMAEGDIVEHFHQTSYAECMAFIRRHPPDAGCRYDVALVRDDDECRAWAYVEDGKLPEYFHDAAGKVSHRVPARFHAEVSKATAGA